MRLIDSCITQLKAQGHYRTCNESKEEEEEEEEAAGAMAPSLRRGRRSLDSGRGIHSHQMHCTPQRGGSGDENAARSPPQL